MVALSHAVRYFLSSLVVLLLPGCTPVHPTTEAVCISECGDSFRHRLVLVWSHDQTVERLLPDWVRGQDVQVVDPIQVQDAIREHHLTLELKPGVEEVLRHLGSLFGADRVLAATILPRSRPLTVMYSGYKEGHPRVTTLFDPTVTVRSLRVDPPTVDWSVTVTGPARLFPWSRQ